MPLHISDDLSLPDEAVTQTFAVLAKRGVGKSYLAFVMVEEMAKAGLPVVVIDPIGVAWGLRSSAAGDGPGLPIVILGGEHGDVPIDETTGEIVADLIIDERLSAVVDLSLLRRGQQRTFVTAFAERLYHRNRQPLHLVLDEGDSWAPQRPLPGEQRMLGAIEDLVRRGRARGIGVTLITQRPAVLHKDVLTQIEVLVTLRLIAPQDRAAIDEWVKVHGTTEQRAELMASLPSLPIGTAWFWSPGWLNLFQRVAVRRRETFDSSATPKLGEQRIEPRSLADVDLAALTARLAATIAKAEADDPKLLRRRIADLERQLKERPATERIVERVEVPILTDDDRALLVSTSEAFATMLRQLTDHLEVPVSQFSRLFDRIIGLSPALPAPPQHTSTRPALAHGRLVESAPTPKTKPVATSTPATNDVTLRAGERKMLAVLARHRTFRITRAQLGTLAGFTPSGGTFGTYLGTLKRAGYVGEDAGILQITDAGLTLFDTLPAPPATTEDLVAQWSSAFRAGERKLLDLLVGSYPISVSRQHLADLAGFEASGGTFGTYLGTLRRNGLIEVDNGQVRASDTLFISEGRGA